MGDLSTYLANELGDHAFRNSSYTPPATVYVGLSTDGASELSGNGYARVAVSFDAWAAKASTNSSAVTFPTPTAGWGTVTHAKLFDASASGNDMAVWKALTVSKVVNAWDTVQFAAGELDLTF